ncbi:MAG: hypothetical protein LAT67_10870 [Balneolales bacterium]|nr:hypothetical protein [Balneolales bacterium]
MPFHTFKNLILIIALLISLASCSRFPAHYVEFLQCLGEESAVAEEVLVAYSEMEEWLIQNQHLADLSRESYLQLLTEMSDENTTLFFRNASPHVRDFWGLQEGASFRSFFSCSARVSEKLGESSAESLSSMSAVYQQMDETAAHTHSDQLEALTNAITDQDFNFLLYRAALLNKIIFMME